MRILVTGDKGYIGAVMVPMLLREGHAVVGLDSDWFEQSAFSEPLAIVSSKKKDVREVEASDLAGFDAVIHLAALSNDPLGDLNPALTYDINHLASVRLAKLAKENGVQRFLFSSSCSTYGAASGDVLLNEEAEFRPVTPYGRSKVLVEQDLLKLADSNFSPTFLRNATAYGVSPRVRFDLVLNNLVAWAVTSGRIYIKSDGTPWRPIVHVEDICRAFIAVLNAPRDLVHAEAFNIGATEENYQIRDLAQMVNDIVPGCRVEYAQDGVPDKRCYRVDFSKVNRKLPAFQPQWTARKGVWQLYDAIQKAALRVEEFEGARYQRILHIRRLMGEGWLDENLRWRDQTAKEHRFLETPPEVA